MDQVVLVRDDLSQQFSQLIHGLYVRLVFVHLLLVVIWMALQFMELCNPLVKYFLVLNIFRLGTFLRIFTFNFGVKRMLDVDCLLLLCVFSVLKLKIARVNVCSCRLSFALEHWLVLRHLNFELFEFFILATWY